MLFELRLWKKPFNCQAHRRSISTQMLVFALHGSTEILLEQQAYKDSCILPPGTMGGILCSSIARIRVTIGLNPHLHERTSFAVLTLWHITAARKFLYSPHGSLLSKHLKEKILHHVSCINQKTNIWNTGITSVRSPQ